MRAKSVGFQRGLDPKIAMGIGDPIAKILQATPTSHKGDDSFFTLELSDGCEAYAMGDQFNPEAYDIELDEMLDLIDKAIKKFLKSKKQQFDYDDLGEDADFFESEFNDDDGGGIADYLSKEYVIAKLICGKESAKSFN